MENTNEAIGKRLKEARLKKGLSQSDVSERLNLSRQAISRWETGRTYPDIENLLRLSQMYEVPIDELLGNMPFVSEEADICKNRAGSNEELIKELEEQIQELREEKKKNGIYEQLCYDVIIAVSCLFPVMGVLVPLGVLLFMVKKKQVYMAVVVFAILCLCISIHSTCLYLNELFFNLGYSGVLKIS